MPRARVSPDAFGISPHRLRLVGALEELGLDLGPVVLQVGGQIVDGHAVDTRCAFVASDLGQRLLQIVPGDNPLHHRPNQGRWAFGGGCRRQDFGSSGESTRGFTLCLTAESQLKLEFLPLGPSRHLLYLRSLTFGPSALRPTMPSADFSAMITGLATRSVREPGHDGDLPR